MVLVPYTLLLLPRRATAGLKMTLKHGYYFVLVQVETLELIAKEHTNKCNDEPKHLSFQPKYFNNSFHILTTFHDFLILLLDNWYLIDQLHFIPFNLTPYEVQTTNTIGHGPLNLW